MHPTSTHFICLSLHSSRSVRSSVCLVFFKVCPVRGYRVMITLRSMLIEAVYAIAQQTPLPLLCFFYICLRYVLQSIHRIPLFCLCLAASTSRYSTYYIFSNYNSPSHFVRMPLHSSHPNPNVICLFIARSIFFRGETSQFPINTKGSS